MHSSGRTASNVPHPEWVTGALGALEKELQRAPAPPERALFEKIAGVSAPLTRFLLRHTDILGVVAQQVREKQEFPGVKAWVGRFGPALRPTDQDITLPSESTALAALRTLRQEAYVRIVHDDLSGAPLQQTLERISHVAEACVELAWEYADATTRRTLEVPHVETSHGTEEATFCVLGMGKLGSFELNYASDIDLIYIYTSDRAQIPARTTPFEYFSHVARLVTRLLSAVTDDGLVFRVDLNLRPEGRSGPIANGVPSSLTYYESWGQTWERFALLRARPIAGDRALGERFLAEVSPFIFRKTLDYTTVDAIRHMKRQIDQQTLSRSGRTFNVKLGEGGIREIEFLAQTLCLAHAGRIPQLKTGNTFDALERLASSKLLDRSEADALADAYTFLRHLEHRIQMQEMSQTQSLPENEDDVAALAVAMGLPRRANALTEELERHRSIVTDAFRGLFSETSLADTARTLPEAALLSETALTPEDERNLIARLPVVHPEDAARCLERIRTGPRRGSSERARTYLARLADAVFRELKTTPDPDAALRHLEQFLSRVGARTTLLALLAENPLTTQTLVRLFGSSNQLSALFIAHPELLDQLVMRGHRTARKSRAQLRHEMAALLATSTDSGFSVEDALDRIRLWRHGELLRIGLEDLAGSLTTQAVMRQISDVADTVVAAALQVSRTAVDKRFTKVETLIAPTTAARGFVVVGLGRLGSREMTYGSDLDLIFLYDESTPLPPGAERHAYESRLAQKLIAAISVPTAYGTAFEVDTRLRPSGNAGPLVSSLEQFARYHASEARIWERQVLLRARAITGDPHLWKRARTIIRKATYHPTQSVLLVAEIQDMRTRVQHELAGSEAEAYDIKRGRGGLMELEFLVQYLQLAHGLEVPSIRSTNTRRALSKLGSAQILSAPEGAALLAAYDFLHTLENRLRVVENKSDVHLPRTPAPAESTARRLATTLGVQSGSELLTLYETHARNIHAAFDAHITKT